MGKAVCMKKRKKEEESFLSRPYFWSLSARSTEDICIFGFSAEISEKKVSLFTLGE
jgi:hypothetical protein|tara:strand:+ start:288 stop:455 length:168 start_codon:yes stop_codon:yes gene_type:complete